MTRLPKDTPTAVEWVADNRFIAGYRCKQKVGVFEADSGELGWEYSFEGKGPSSQANCLQLNSQLKMLAGGHEDHFIRFFDPNSSKFLSTQTNASNKSPLTLTLLRDCSSEERASSC